MAIAIEIAREGREGRRIGPLFTLASADAVLAPSRALIPLPPAFLSVTCRVYDKDVGIR
jgi:DNA integrity scanning protein DisA with diadenylate cyclase activity